MRLDFFSRKGAKFSDRIDRIHKIYRQIQREILFILFILSNSSLRPGGFA